MLVESGFGFGMPDLTLLVRQILPGKTNDLGERAVVRLDLSRHVLALDERRAEEDEGIGWAGDMVLRLLLAVSRTTPGWAIGWRGEEDSLSSSVFDEHGWLVVCHGGDIGGEGDALMGGRLHRSPSKLGALGIC